MPKNLAVEKNGCHTSSVTIFTPRVSSCMLGISVITACNISPQSLSVVLYSTRNASGGLHACTNHSSTVLQRMVCKVVAGQTKDLQAGQMSLSEVQLLCAILHTVSIRHCHVSKESSCCIDNLISRKNIWTPAGC